MDNYRLQQPTIQIIPFNKPINFLYI